MNGIVAFCASKKSGKSTAFEFFKEYYPGEVEEIALAGHLKTVCSKVFNIDMKYFVYQNLKEVELDTFVVLNMKNIISIFKEFNIENSDIVTTVKPHMGKILMTPRSLLQYVGTEVLHPIDPLIHAKKAIGLKDPNKLTIITDLRFINEHRFLRDQKNFEFDGYYIDNRAAAEAASTDLHPSERELDTFKHDLLHIDNNGSLNQFRENIKSIVEKKYIRSSNATNVK